MKLTKLLTQSGGWASIATALVTLLLKQFGFEVEESVILPLIVGGLDAQAGAKFIPTAPPPPVMSGLHNQTIDALFHLDRTLLPTSEVDNAIRVLWNAARTIRTPEVK